MRTDPRPCIAFAGTTRIASGSLREVALAVSAWLEQGNPPSVLIYDAVTSEPVEIDLRGTAEEVLGRLEVQAGAGFDGSAEEESVESSPPSGRGRGRPRLGVIGREVTLLPRHWEWLGQQPGGASVTLRKLVEAAKRSSAGETRLRQAREACYRFMTVMAGNEPGFEEASRALFAGEQERFDGLVENWPSDVRDHVRQLAEGAFPEGD